jgi:hypothetical protein
MKEAGSFWVKAFLSQPVDLDFTKSTKFLNLNLAQLIPQKASILLSHQA